jgi:hypothetical protein
LRRILVLCVLLAGVLVFGWLRWREASARGQLVEAAAPEIIKQPVQFSQRTFDPANPPADMPAMPPGEAAECDSNFQSGAHVSGETRQTDATHGTVTVTHVKVNLQLNVTIWTPADVSPHVVEHEDGHRQISEYYYQTADQVAERIAAMYMGKQVDIAGADLDTESSKALQQMADEITAEYGKELNPQPAQLLYDSITDHSRNEVVAKDAVDHSLKNVLVEAN